MAALLVAVGLLGQAECLAQATGARGSAGLTPASSASGPGGAGAPAVASGKTAHLTVELVSASDAVAPGGDVKFGLRLKHESHWHTYWKNPGDSGLPTQFELNLPAGVTADPIVWPTPHRVFVAPLANYGYENETLLPRLIHVPASFKGDALTVQAKVSWLVCKQVCIPGDAELSLTIPVRPGKAGPSVHQALFEQAAAATPAGRLKVGVLAQGGKLALFLPATVGRAHQAEFFSEVEETIVHAGAQVLFRQSDGGLRLEVPLVTDKKPDFSKDASRARGVLVVDGKAFDLDPVPVAADPGRAMGAGELVATVKGVDEAMPDTASPADKLLKASGAMSSPPAPVPASASAATAAARLGAGGAAADGASPRGGTTLLLSLGGALVGGLILNLMPCVFPVIGLKLLSFAGHGGSGTGLTAGARRRLRFETLAFSTGVVLSFVLLGALMLSLRAAGEAVGWGFQLQSPMFVGSMFLLFTALGLNFAGVFELGLGLTRLGNMQSHNLPGQASSSPQAWLKAMFAGGLAVLVATPCTAPFMGSALGFSLAQPAWEALLIFVALGLGMALPYLVLAAFPAWLTHLPRPGRWMETFKQFLAFPMFAAAVWLLWVFGLQTSLDGLMKLALGGVSLAFALWLYGRTVQASSLGANAGASGLRKGTVLVAIMLAALGAFASLFTQRDSMEASPELAASKPGGIRAEGGSAVVDPASQDWQPWSDEAVRQALAKGQPVFVDFTAAWCVSCQANKKLVLDTDGVKAAFADKQILKLRADWTRKDPLITSALASLGRSGVPLYLLYLPGQSAPLILPELLTRGIVLSAIAEVKR